MLFRQHIVEAEPLGRADPLRHAAVGLHFILGQLPHAAAVRSPRTLKLMSFALLLTDELPLHKEHCCDAMTEQANQTYPGAKSALLGSTDKRIYWSSLFDEYGLICQPSAEVLVISHCPFCGFQLPSSLRAEWFEKLEKMGWQT